MHRHRWLIALAAVLWTVTALLAAGLATTHWRTVVWSDQTSYRACSRGTIRGLTLFAGAGASFGGPHGWRLLPPAQGPTLHLGRMRVAFPQSMRVHLWPWLLVPLTAAGLATRLAFMARRRIRAGACLACGYDLSGLAAGQACPECGALRARSPAVGG